MNTFNLIQNFFTRMACQFCGIHFEPDDVQLVGEGHGFYIVSVQCHDCGQHNGTAAVGVETHEQALEIDEQDVTEGIPLPRRRFKDPEFTEEDFQRLAQFDPVTENDVLAAHEFIQQLDDGWLKFIPEGIRQRYTAPETE